MRVTHRGYLRATQVGFLALYAIIITGSLVRLTGSGLGCADWPKCSESKFVDVSTGHAAIEQINRLFTGFVAAAVIACVLLSLRLMPRRRDLIGMSVVLVVGVLAQVLIGAVVVLTGLNPYSNIAHFIVSIFLISVSYMLVQHAKIFRTVENTEPRGEPVISNRRLQTLIKGLLFTTGCAVVTGTIVTGSGPHAGDENAVRIGLAMTSIVKVHSAAVWLTVLILLFTFITVRKSRIARDLVGRPLVIFAIVLGFQGILGYSQYFLGVPVLLVAIHVALSVLAWLGALNVYWNSRLSAIPKSVLD